MPVINIQELNATSATPLGNTEGLPVAIVGCATDGPITVAASTPSDSNTVFTPVLCNSLSQFKSIFGSAAPSSLPYGYNAAVSCLMNGNSVWFTRIGAVSGGTALAKASLPITPSSGTADIAITATDYGTDGNNFSAIVNYATNAYTITLSKNSTAIGTFSGITYDKLPFSNEYITVTAGSGVSTFTGNVSIQTATAFTGGKDGDGITSASIYTQIRGVLDVLSDSNLYQFVVFAAPGLTHSNSGDAYVAEAFIDYTEGTSITGTAFTHTRQDVVMIVDCAPTNSSSSPNDVLSGVGLTNGSIEANYVAIFYPWFTTANGAQPPSIAYLRAFTNLQSDGYPCRAVAGPTYSTISGITALNTTVGSQTAQTLSDARINPITYHRNYGYYIDGNNVLNQTSQNRTYGQLNVRQTINYIKRQLDDICMQLAYITDVNRAANEFMGATTRMLDQLKSMNFLYSYNVTINNRATAIADGQLIATVSIFPTPSVEVFEITLRVVNVEDAL